ncbi:hypothetical protein IIA16_02295 [bacterium]|nr:hypothetical protein [bacterium]
MGRLEDLASAVAVIVPAFPFSLLFSGITHQCVQLRFLSRGDKRVRVLELKLADEEAFLDALAAADPALARSPGRVVRVPASALEEADG